MSSTHLTSDDLMMIECLLAEVRAAGPEGRFDIETAQARLLIYAFADGISVEADLRSLLAKHTALNSSLDCSSRRWRAEGVAPNHRQEHMLPSPEEEFNAAKTIHPMTAAPHDGKPLVGRNAAGETAMISWMPDRGAANSGCWVRLDDGKHFEAVHWVQTTWTAIEVLEHSSVSGSSR
ncbi:hypothetical protein [Chelativorans salis]|uniref:DUF551 domain-containing protein n=1 Tax=Chelativorans salis TaxID=2978478 RepID=A0ABT2LPF5_9HYPH|nr:hypothetical protein [Chelativorans sp. EGI FJ00035]MCT7375538.1 hypothetical protein [Chelativorans sp. EGI FJ00035]